ncbi:MAG TPA: ABC transporter permease [Roseomonas sp.]|nr:ABC transporter permease [Roseomonas sp.]
MSVSAAGAARLRLPPLLAFLLRRLLRLALLLVCVAALAFALARAAPVDPVEAFLGPAAAQVGPEQRAAIAARWGFDQPAPVQFLHWLGQALRGDLGESSIFAAPVAQVIGERFAASLALMLPAWILGGALGFGLGLAAGAREGGWLDRVIRLYAYLLTALPGFWLAMLLLIVFAVWLGWAPVCCAVPPGLLPDQVSLGQRLAHLVLPVAALSVLGVGPVALHTRAKVAEAMRADFVLYAFAQGAGRAEVALRHAARHAALPALTILFAGMGELFGGSVVAEQVFAWPGLGRAAIEAGLRADVPLLLGIALATALFVGCGNLIADLLAQAVDPRQRRRA